MKERSRVSLIMKRVEKVVIVERERERKKRDDRIGKREYWG